METLERIKLSYMCHQIRKAHWWSSKKLGNEKKIKHHFRKADLLIDNREVLGNGRWYLPVIRLQTELTGIVCEKPRVVVSLRQDSAIFLPYFVLEFTFHQFLRGQGSVTDLRKIQGLGSTVY